VHRNAKKHDTGEKCVAEEKLREELPGTQLKLRN